MFCFQFSFFARNLKSRIRNVWPALGPMPDPDRVHLSVHLNSPRGPVLLYLLLWQSFVHLAFLIAEIIFHIPSSFLLLYVHYSQLDLDMLQLRGLAYLTHLNFDYMKVDCICHRLLQAREIKDSWGNGQGGRKEKIRWCVVKKNKVK